MRLKPIAPVLILQAIRDSVVADVRVPKGTLVFGALRTGGASPHRPTRLPLGQ